VLENNMVIMFYT